MEFPSLQSAYWKRLFIRKSLLSQKIIQSGAILLSVFIPAVLRASDPMIVVPCKTEDSGSLQQSLMDISKMRGVTGIIT